MRISRSSSSTDRNGLRISAELFEQRAAQRRLAGANVAGENDEAFLAADGLPDLLQREVV
jgi:hypothetical protein